MTRPIFSTAVFVLCVALYSPATPAAAGAQAAVSAGDMVFDIRNGDQTGKLMLKETELAFESLTDSRHSRNWKYSEIRELSKKGRKDFRVRPVKGSRYDFQCKDKSMRENIYNLISERILVARQGLKK
ncbi:MAG: hypothetical protein R2762_23995 [Bryobacteraceae bacterium]